MSQPEGTPEPKPATTCARPLPEPESTSRPLVPPLQLSAVYQFASIDHVDAVYQGGAAGYIYSRDGHPNATELAHKIALLEGAEAALVCASGMAAEAAAFLSTLESGDHLALSDGLYGKTVSLATRELPRFGITCSFFDATRPETLRMALTPRTRFVFVETLSNPLVRLAEIEALADLAHDGGAMLVVDNTFAPLLCRPIPLGADLVTHSATKLIGGHSDLMAGLLAGPRAFIDRASSVASVFGLNGNPFESWLTLRGLASLSVRSERACANALSLAERLEAHSRVAAVHYPGLPSHPDHQRASHVLAGGFGAIVTIDLGDRTNADTFIRSLHHIPFAPSLGDVATTLSHPASTSHRGQSAEQWERQGITPGLVRLSIGLEDVDDLWADMSQALATA